MDSRSALLLRPRRDHLVFAGAVAVTLLIGLVDYLSGYEVSLFVFYGGPILAAAWFCDRKRALLLAIVCGIVWWWADLLAGHSYSHEWLNVWEPASRFGYFAAVAIGGSAMRAQRDAAESRVALLEHSQQLEREIVQISEREQRRIGRDLHDGLCQYLAALGCSAASLRADLLQRGLEIEARAAEELSQLLNQGAVQARDLARGLVPVRMDEAGLASALEELADSVSRLQNIQCTVHYDDTAAAAAPSATTHLYRIVQEAISNATRHGGANRIRISLAAANENARLTIHDNGCGISKGSATRSGLGIGIMSYRARLVGGELAISEPPEGGTRITCTFPRSLWRAESYGQAA